MVESQSGLVSFRLHPDCDSTISLHFLENEQCALNYENKRFSIFAIARSLFHLNLLEAVYINSQTLSIIAVFLFGLLLRFFWHFAICKVCFFGALYNTSAIIGLS